MTVTAVIAAIIATPLAAAALIPTITDLAARRRTRHERQWLAQWRADRDHTPGDPQ